MDDKSKQALGVAIVGAVTIAGVALAKGKKAPSAGKRPGSSIIFKLGLRLNSDNPLDVDIYIYLGFMEAARLSVGLLFPGKEGTVALQGTVPASLSGGVIYDATCLVQNAITAEIYDEKTFPKMVPVIE